MDKCLLSPPLSGLGTDISPSGLTHIEERVGDTASVVTQSRNALGDGQSVRVLGAHRGRRPGDADTPRAVAAVVVAAGEGGVWQAGVAGTYWAVSKRKVSPWVAQAQG